MPNLDLVITGDCISAVTALQNTERAVGSLQSSTRGGVGVAVSVLGARAASKDLGSVSSAIGATHTAAAGLNRTPIGGGLAAGAVAARGLTSSLGGTNRAMNDTTTGAGILAASGTRATRSLGGMVPVLAGMRSGLAGVGSAAGRVAALPVAIPGGRGGVATIGSAIAATDRHRQALARQQLQALRGQPAMAAVNAGTRTLADNANNAAGAMTRLGGAAAAPIPVGSLGYLGNLREGLREGMLQGLGGDPDAAEPRRGLPPVVPPPPRGGGRGGGGGAPDPDRDAAAAGKAGGEIGKGIGALLMAGMAAGIATNASYTKYAMDAINTTISETPGLAEKATEAADELGKGIKDITTGANLAQYADAYERLGTANRALGQVKGQIGMDNLGTNLANEAEMADATTRAYGRMAPAMNSAIRGSHNLGMAMLEGISNPQVVNGVRSLGDSLAQPEIAKGLKDITTGAASAGLVFGKIFTETVGFASRLANTVVGGQNLTDMSGALTGGGMLAGLAFSKYGLKGGLATGAAGASGIGLAQYQMAHGQDNMILPTVINEVLGGIVGGLIGGPAGMAGGSIAGGQATQWVSQIPGMEKKGAFDVTSAIGGALAGFRTAGPRGIIPGAAIGFAGGDIAQTALGQDPTERYAGLTTPAAKHTLNQEMRQRAWDQSHPGQPMPASDPNSVTSDSHQGQTLMEHLFGGGTPAAKQEPVQPGPQQPDAPSGPYPIVKGLLSRQSATQDRVAQERQARGLRPAGTGSGPVSPPPAPITAAPAGAVQQLGQSAQQATQSVQGLGQATTQVAQQAQAVPMAYRPVAQTMQSFPQQAQQQMNTAASSISNSAQQVGQAIPPAVSTGIVKSTPKVCDAAADMGQSMVNCTAGALRSASPSKKFIALGESTGDGATIGVNNSAGGAIDAVGSMASGMLEQVGAFGSGVQAASEGAVPMAESGGLMVGYVWARSVATGVDSVLKQADFAQASMPAINSALAKTALGKLGLLGLAGSGASISKTAGGGFVNMPAPVINVTVQAVLDGSVPIRTISQQVVDTAFDELADSFGRQRG